jgi:hypothetical protein
LPDLRQLAQTFREFIRLLRPEPEDEEHPRPLVPYTLLALAILFVSRIVVPVRRRREVEPVEKTSSGPPTTSSAPL